VSRVGLVRQQLDILRHWAVASATGRPRRPEGRHLWALAHTDGRRFSALAQRLAAVFPGGSRPRITTDPATGGCLMDDGRVWRFVDKRRVRLYLAGLAARADVLSEEYLLRSIPFHDGDHVVDIGANVGDFALALNAVHPATVIHCFEPSPAEFACLTANLESNDLCAGHELHAIAAWQADEEVVFHVKSSSADSSILPVAEGEGEIRVPARRLDGFLEDRPYRLLKLEAEGAEPEILEGAGDSIARFHYVAADVGFERGQHAESTLPQVTNFLLARGFEVAGVSLPRLVVLYRNTAWIDVPEPQA